LRTSWQDIIKMTGNNNFMQAALNEAELAGIRGEIPVGAVLVDTQTNRIITAAGNRVEACCDPTAHAEMLVIREACHLLGTARLPLCDLYVTLEPCAMCAQAIAFARIRRLYFAAYDKKGGGVEHGACIFSQPTCHHRPEVYGGIEEMKGAALLEEFFRKLR
jgi:tRNA(adenine34) deaminase